MALPFFLPEHELAPDSAGELVRDAAKIILSLERKGERASRDRRRDARLTAARPPVVFR